MKYYPNNLDNLIKSEKINFDNSYILKLAKDLISLLTLMEA